MVSAMRRADIFEPSFPFASFPRSNVSWIYHDALRHATPHTCMYIVRTCSYLTRGMGNLCGVDMEEDYPWPTCATHYNLATSFQDFYSWVIYSHYEPHGHAHLWIGGAVDCEEDYSKISELVGEETSRNLVSLAFTHRRELYRNGFFSCVGSADVSQKSKEVNP